MSFIKRFFESVFNWNRPRPEPEPTEPPPEIFPQIPREPKPEPIPEPKPVEPVPDPDVIEFPVEAEDKWWIPEPPPVAPEAVDSVDTPPVVEAIPEPKPEPIPVAPKPEPVYTPEPFTPSQWSTEVIFGVDPNVRKPNLQVNQFSFNTDGSTNGHLSGSHLGQTASGIGNGGEVLGYTLPLNRSLKKLRYNYAGLFEAAILTFNVPNQAPVKVLAVGNDTGGRWMNDRYDRNWGELGINTFRAVQKRGVAVKIGHNALNVPDGMTVTYEFLNQKVRTVQDYRNLKNVLHQTGKL